MDEQVPSLPGAEPVSGVSGIIVDHADATGATRVGAWTASTSSSGYRRTDDLHDGNTGATSSKSVTFSPANSAWWAH
jgi:hypothetical protein